MSINATPATDQPNSPRIRINLKQLASGEWRRDETVELIGVDLLGGYDRAHLAMVLAQVDTLVRAEIERREEA